MTTNVSTPASSREPQMHPEVPPEFGKDLYAKRLPITGDP
jgi:hypothetical protein